MGYAPPPPPKHQLTPEDASELRRKIDATYSNPDSMFGCPVIIKDGVAPANLQAQMGKYQKIKVPARLVKNADGQWVVSNAVS